MERLGRMRHVRVRDLETGRLVVLERKPASLTRAMATTPSRWRAYRIRCTGTYHSSGERWTLDRCTDGTSTWSVAGHRRWEDGDAYWKDGGVWAADGAILEWYSYSCGDCGGSITCCGSETASGDVLVGAPLPETAICETPPREEVCR
jgi:hypothetical protein